MPTHPSLPQLPSLPPLDLSAAPGAGRPFAIVPPDQASLNSPLRKSISVDSFAASPAPRSPRDPQSSNTRGFVAGITSAFRRDSVLDLRSRNRGASVGEQHHRDQEHRFRLPSFKASDRRAELPASQEQPPAAVGRVRSVSSGTPSSPGSRRIVINTQPTNVASSLNENITLIVIGVTGCGKSQAIRMGLSGFNLSDPLPSTVQRTVRGVSAPLYTYRLGTIVRDRFPDCPLTVIEIDTSPDDAHVPKNHLWPEPVPSIDGAVICYDAGDRSSFKPVEQLVRAYHTIKLPIIVLACKADLNLQIEPAFVSGLLNQYRAGLVEVSTVSDAGRAKLRRSFDWVLKAVFRHRQAIDTTNVVDHAHISPASPDILISPPQDKSTPATPVTVHPRPPPLPTPPPQYHQSQSPGYFPDPPENPVTSNELPSAVSTGRVDGENKVPLASHDQNTVPQSILKTGNDGVTGPLANDIQKVSLNKPKDKLKSAQFATLDTLLDKLLFITISGDDPNFVSSFLLTYRRFCTPRSVLLAMQKKMHLLNESSDDPLFSSFAQMGICRLLEVWIADYPTDFAVNGSAGALTALIRSMLAKPHLLHYGSQLLPFLEVLPTLQDQDSGWGVQPEIKDESDVEDFLDDDEDLQPDKCEQEALSPQSPPDTTPPAPLPPRVKTNISQSNTRDRKPGPLMRSLGLVLGGSSDYDQPTKQQLKELVRISNELIMIDPSDIAEEITRIQAKYFLAITNRDWMRFVFLKQKKPDDPIVALNKYANHIGDWVVSVILCHDKLARRARQMEKMAEVAARLRTLNNYSALRAFVAGINSAAYPGDETMELFKSRSPEHAKSLRSWELLLQQIRAHRAYRLALRNSKGACIPAMEVHIADMVKTQESNRDYKEGDPTQIHWAKFSMMGRFVSITSQCQNQCRSSSGYDLPERTHIRDLFHKRTVMSPDLQRMRLKDPDEPDAQPSRKLFFW